MKNRSDIWLDVSLGFALATAVWFAALSAWQVIR